MKIISASFTDRNIEDMETVKGEFGLANSSETLRVALKFALEKLKDEKGFRGSQTAVLVIRHFHQTERFVSETKHDFQSLVKSQNHYCSTGDECVDMFLLHGPAGQIKKMRNKLFNNKEILKIALVPL